MRKITFALKRLFSRIAPIEVASRSLADAELEALKAQAELELEAFKAQARKDWAEGLVAYNASRIKRLKEYIANATKVQV